MTSLLRRKRRTTARARSTPTPTPVSLVAVGLLLLAAGLAPAQEPLPLPPLPPATWQPSDLRPAPGPRPASRAPVIYNLHKAAEPAEPDPEPIRQAQGPGVPRAPAGTMSTEQIDSLLQLLPPSFERLTRLQSEAALREQIRQEEKDKTSRVPATFPEEKPVTEESYAPHEFAPQVTLAEPHYVNYKRLYFQDLNSERYGWELGFVQPFVSAGLFYADLALLPYHFASRPFDCVQSSAGYCLPGDPVPYLLYPPDLSVTGAVGEAGAILGLIAIFP